MILVSLALAGAAIAQETPQFEVASIKPNTSVRTGYSVNTDKHGEFIAESVTLRNLISYAYRVKEFQIQGGAKWVDSEHYDVFAKPPEAGDIADAASRLRVKAMLADRFQLTVHPETRDLPVYLLTVAKNGPHLDPAKHEDKWTGIQGKRGQMTCRAVTMRGFAEWGLTPRLGNIVIDRTGLDGEFDFVVRYIDDSPPKPGAEAPPVETDPSLPSLLIALDQQLGLKLTTGKAPVETIVIDSATRPTGN